MAYLPRKEREARKKASLLALKQASIEKKKAGNEVSRLCHREARGIKARMVGYIARPSDAKTRVPKPAPSQDIKHWAMVHSIVREDTSGELRGILSTLAID